MRGQGKSCDERPSRTKISWQEGAVAAVAGASEASASLSYLLSFCFADSSG